MQGATKHVAVIGMGNVALDVARILSKTEAEFEGADIVAHALAFGFDSAVPCLVMEAQFAIVFD